MDAHSALTIVRLFTCDTRIWPGNNRWPFIQIRVCAWWVELELLVAKIWFVNLFVQISHKAPLKGARDIPRVITSFDSFVRDMTLFSLFCPFLHSHSSPPPFFINPLKIIKVISPTLTSLTSCASHSLPPNFYSSSSLVAPRRDSDEKCN